MARSKREDWNGCPIRFGMGHFGDPWTLLIIRDLMFQGKRHYSDFLGSGEGIASNILADRLKRLHGAGIVDKTRDPDNRSKFIYTLTAKGLDLMPIMLAIIDWSATYDDATEAPPEFIAQLREDPDTLMRTLRARLVDGA